MSRDYCKTSFIHCSSSTSLAVGSTVPGLLLDLCLPNCYGDRLGKGRLEILEISTEKYHFKLSGFGSTLILFHNRIRNAVPPAGYRSLKLTTKPHPFFGHKFGNLVKLGPIFGSPLKKRLDSNPHKMNVGPHY